MKRPPYGLSIPVSVVRVRDGDTIEVSVRGSDRRYAIRLIDVWAPELNRGSEASRMAGQRAKQFAESTLAASKEISVFIPLPKDPLRILKALSFDRIPAWVYVSEKVTLNALLVRYGLATTSKPK